MAIAQLDRVGLESAYDQARAGSPEVSPRRVLKLTPIQELVGLQRRWKLARPEIPVPDDLDILQQIIPSGLTRREKSQWTFSACEEAKYAWLKLYNQSWSKAELAQRTADAGIARALEAFDRETQKSLRSAIRMLSDD